MGLTKMQEKLLDMLVYFHNFCEANHLRYYIIGGTLLGAARHKGFIPWDDDIDVGMPRKDYEHFLQLSNNQIDSQYVVESVSSEDENFCYPFAKLYDTSTTLIESTAKSLKRGIYLDVFPLDGAGNTEKEAERHCKQIERKKKILSLRTIKANGHRSKYKDVLLNAVQALPKWIINDKQICRQIDGLCKKYDFDNCSIVGNLNGAWGVKEIVPREYFGDPVQYEFENLTVFGIEEYDKYLTHIYGDWRKLPPKEQQISHHSYTIYFNESYLD